MGDLTKNFSLKEFKCKDGTSVPPIFIENVTELAANLQVLRDAINKPIIINSGYRTPTYNKKVGGAKTSQHLTASAADIRVEGMTPQALKATIEGLILQGKMKNGGLGLYPTFCHYDVRDIPARW